MDADFAGHLSYVLCREWQITNAGLDPSNKDDGINMAKWNIWGMLMPDTIQVYTGSDGVEYLVTANEGDDKVSIPSANNAPGVHARSVLGLSG